MTSARIEWNSFAIFVLIALSNLVPFYCQLIYLQRIKRYTSTTDSGDYSSIMALENNEKAVTEAANGKTLNQLRIILIELRWVWEREIYYRFYGARTDISLLLFFIDAYF